MPDTSVSRRYVTPPGSSTSHRRPPIPPRTAEENIYEDVQMNTARKNLSSDAERLKKAKCMRLMITLFLTKTQTISIEFI